MATLGEALRSARQQRGLSLADVQGITKIRGKYLAALEADKHDELPAPVYTRGYVRSLSRCVGLDAAQMVALYDQAQPKRETVGVQREVRPMRVPSAVTGRTLLGIGVIVALLAAASFVYDQYNLALSSEQASVDTNLAGAATIGATPAAASLADPIPQAKPTSSPVPTPAPSPTATPIQGVHIVVRLSERSWLRVMVDDKEVYQGIPQIGSVLRWDGHEKIFMRTGNAGGTEVSFNGKPGETLGAPGEVKDVQWTARR